MNLGILIGGIIFALIIGGLTAWKTKQFAEVWAVALLAAWGGFVLGLIVAKVIGIKSGAGSLGIGLACGLIGGWLGRKLDRLLKCAGTAFVGSYCVVRGV